LSGMHGPAQNANIDVISEALGSEVSEGDLLIYTRESEMA